MKLSSVNREWTQQSNAMSPKITMDVTGGMALDLAGVEHSTFLRASICPQRLKPLQRWLDSLGSSCVVPLLLSGGNQG